MTKATFTLDQTTIDALVQQAVESNINELVDNLVKDPAWQTRVERLVNERITQETLTKINSMDINTVIKDRVDENLERFKAGLKGIADQATATQLTIMDDDTVVENTLTTRGLHVVDGATINHLAVKGSINTDNQAWTDLAKDISNKTLEFLNVEWRGQLVDEVTQQIQNNGINFEEVLVKDQPLVTGNKLSAVITESTLESVGRLRDLTVDGPTNLGDTLTTNKKRVGINTESPETALSIWDEEVSINVGKLKSNEAYIGTGRQQNLTLSVNRVPQVELNVDGITTIKRLRVGVNTIGHSSEVPGWSGTKGDIVFNANPTDAVFGWVCLGAFRWKQLKSAE